MDWELAAKVAAGIGALVATGLLWIGGIWVGLKLADHRTHNGKGGAR